VFASRQARQSPVVEMLRSSRLPHEGSKERDIASTIIFRCSNYDSLCVCVIKPPVLVSYHGPHAYIEKCIVLTNGRKSHACIEKYKASISRR
jgi:hypothetical protein